MTFQWIGLLLLLAVVPIVVAIYVRTLRRRRPSAARYSSLALIRDAAPGTSRLRRHLPFALVAAAMAALVIALGRPAVVVGVPTNQTTIILTIDVSGSMCSTDIAPTRLEAAEEAAIAFVTSQQARTEIGIVAFSGFGAVVQPPTTDQKALIDAIHSLTTGRRTAIGSGILAAIDAIAEVDPNIARSVIPGRPGAEPPPVAAGAYAPDIIVLLGGGGGFGGGGRFPRGIDEPTLKAMADLTGGTYSPAASAAELQQVFANLPTTLITKRESLEISVGFVGIGGLLAAFGLLLGRAWRPLP